MTEQERLQRLAHIEQALAEADRPHTPEELAAAAHELELELSPAQASLILRPAA